MKKIFIPLVLLAVACNNTTPESKSAVTTPETTIPETPVVTDKTPEAYFTARGNEPGWSLDIKASFDGTFPIVLIDNYGKDTLTGNLQKEGLMKDGKSNVRSGEVKLSGVLEGASHGEVVSISLLSEECTDDAGKAHTHKCEVKYARRTLRGCGEYSE